MDIEQWRDHVRAAFAANGADYPDELHARMMQPDSADDWSLKGSTEIFIDSMYLYFFRKAAAKECFGDPERIRQKFGQTLEENYGIGEGPFLNLARTYWTFRIELDDLLPTDSRTVFIGALRIVEKDIASYFFPTPGPASVPWKLRQEKMREILQNTAPEFDVEEFLSKNPILESDRARQRGGFFKRLFGFGK